MRRKEYQYQRDLTVNVGKCLWADPDKFGRSNFGKDGGRGGSASHFCRVFFCKYFQTDSKIANEEGGGGAKSAPDICFDIN